MPVVLCVCVGRLISVCRGLGPAQRQVRRKQAAAHAGKMQVRPKRVRIVKGGAGSAERLAVADLSRLRASRSQQWGGGPAEMEEGLGVQSPLLTPAGGHMDPVPNSPTHLFPSTSQP